MPRTGSRSSSRCRAWGGRRRRSCSATRSAGTRASRSTRTSDASCGGSGFTDETDPVKVERVLLELVPRRDLDDVHAPADRARARDLPVAHAALRGLRAALAVPRGRAARRRERCVTHSLHPARVARHTPGPSLGGMDRLDLELYADRLARHSDRLSDDLEAARLRMSWSVLEREARAALGARRSALLEAVGVIADDGAGDDDAALVARRRQQLGALEALQAHVEMRIAELVHGRMTLYLTVDRAVHAERVVRLRRPLEQRAVEPVAARLERHDQGPRRARP